MPLRQYYVRLLNLWKVCFLCLHRYETITTNQCSADFECCSHAHAPGYRHHDVTIKPNAVWAAGLCAVREKEKDNG